MVTLSTAARNAGANAYVDLLDLGSTNPNGTLTYQTSGAATLAVLQLSNPAAGAAVAGVATFNAITTAAATAAGTAALAILSDRDANAVISDITVGTTGANINFNSVTWTIGDDIATGPLTLTQPAT